MRPRRSGWFFVGTSGTLLAALLVAFSPTFFLRGFFDVLPIPTYLYVHGTLLTAWFVLVFVQTCLVAAHRTDVHRRLGILGAIIAILVVVHASVVNIRAVPRLPADEPTVVASVVIWNFLALILFSMMVAAAVYFRGRPETHKRLMLLACFSLIGPVVGRLGMHLFGLPPGVAVEFERPAVMLLLVVLLTHDLTSTGSVHPATRWGSLVLIVILVLSWTMARTSVGLAFIDALR